LVLDSVTSTPQWALIRLIDLRIHHRLIDNFVSRAGEDRGLAHAGLKGRGVADHSPCR